MATKKQTTKPEISISTSQDMIDSFKALAKSKGMTHGELLEVMMDKFTEKLDEEPTIDFIFVGKEQSEKEPFLRDIFGLNKHDKLVVSEKELLQKATELSNKSVDELTKKGRVMAAKQEIGFHIQKNLGKGKRGSADDKLIITLKYLLDNSITLSINKIVQGDGSAPPSYRPTVERFVDDNNLRTSPGSSSLDPDAVESFLGGIDIEAVQKRLNEKKIKEAEKKGRDGQ